MNTVTPDTCLVFNKTTKRADWDSADKPCWIYVKLTEWVSDEDMTDKEKEAYPSYVTTMGYLKCYSDLHHAYVESWEKASKEDKLKTFKLPNYDEDIFKEIFGFTPNITNKKKIVIDGKEIEISEDRYNELKASLLNG